MRFTSAVAIFAGALSVSGVADVSVFAQSDTRTVRESHASTVFARHSVSPVLRVYRSEPTLMESRATPPPNLTFPDFFRPTIEMMLERSTTFRRQVHRIGSTSGLEVELTSVAGGASAGPRARTQIARNSEGRMVARVTLRRFEDVPELIAHELEHVIEQLDGVNLRSRSALAGTGVWSCDDGSFETTRATRVGLAVASETIGR